MMTMRYLPLFMMYPNCSIAIIAFLLLAAILIAHEKVE